MNGMFSGQAPIGTESTCALLAFMEVIALGYCIFSRHVHIFSGGGGGEYIVVDMLLSM